MNDHDTESVLAHMPRPQVVAGAHRSDLKTRLLESAAQPRARVATRRPRWAMVACCVTLLLTASGWAAHVACLKYFVVEESQDDVQVMPDGSVLSTSSVVSVSTDDPTMTRQDADQHWQATKAAIAQGNYVLMDVSRNASGEICYCYAVLLEDGASIGFGTPHPLPSTTTLEKD
jgi:hypothetical protein